MSDFSPTASRSLEDLLIEINRELPPFIDWKAGAKTYLQQVFEREGLDTETYLLNKPFAHLKDGPDHASRATFLDLLHNFTNVMQLLRLPVGSRILDVACGAGWLSHWLMRLGFDVVGIDMSADLLQYARLRIQGDPLLKMRATELAGSFLEHDLEADPLPAVIGTFDAAIFESCLHHFFNPVIVLTHVARALRSDGVAVLIEGENRQGPLKPEYIDVMHQFATIERPYSRSQLSDILIYSGLPYVAFFGAVNGWYTPESPQTWALPEYVLYASGSSNRSVCAKSESALRRIVSDWRPSAHQSVVARCGISVGTSDYSWSAPHCVLMVQSVCRRITIEFGSHLPGVYGKPQCITVATNTSQRKQVTLTPGGGTVTIELSQLEPGTQIHCVSSDVFSPAWHGEADQRVLSFWIAVRNEHRTLLIPAA